MAVRSADRRSVRDADARSLRRRRASAIVSTWHLLSWHTFTGDMALRTTRFAFSTDFLVKDLHFRGDLAVAL